MEYPPMPDLAQFQMLHEMLLAVLHDVLLAGTGGLVLLLGLCVTALRLPWRHPSEVEECERSASGVSLPEPGQPAGDPRRSATRPLLGHVALLLCLGLAAPAGALTVISTDTTLPDDPIYGDTINDTVNVVGSAVLTINMGGSIGGVLGAHGTTQLTVSGGSIGEGVLANDSATVIVTGGSIGGLWGLTSQEDSVIDVFGTCLRRTRGRLTGTLQDGTALDVTAFGNLVLHGTDTTPPTIVIGALSVTPALLWPPNHTLVPVTVSATAIDTCSGVTCQIVRITSNEPDNGLGDGDTANDIQQTGPLTAKLRAERSGGGNGRIYTITVACTDASSNTSTGTGTVTVPLYR